MNFLGTKEAAKKLNLSPIRLRQLIKSGRLRAKKIGAVYLIKEADLENIEKRPTGRPKKQHLKLLI